jgi:hypothetical protein
MQPVAEWPIHTAPNRTSGTVSRAAARGSEQFVGSRSITLAAKHRKVQITEGADERTIEAQTTQGSA